MNTSVFKKSKPNLQGSLTNRGDFRNLEKRRSSPIETQSRVRRVTYTRCEALAHLLNILRVFSFFLLI